MRPTATPPGGLRILQLPAGDCQGTASNLNEYGFTIGGPIKKNKLFFFESFEFFDLPQSFPETGCG